MLSSSTKADQSTQITLLRKLTNLQNIVTTEKELMSFLYKLAVYHIDIKNQKILYRFLYNLFFCELKMLHKYLNNALIKN